MHEPRIACALCAAALALIVLPCRAELGGKVSTVAGDQARMMASRRVEAGSAFTRHVMTTPAGGEVVEYVSPSGVVFAVSWQGPVKPDLEQLLGDSFKPFHEAALAQTSARRPLSLRQSNLVVHSRGRMRDFSGMAYLPDQLPAGVTAQDIR
jgi:hypothetical protein